MLANIRWKFGENLFFPNPVKLEEISNELSSVSDVMLICTDITEDRIEYETIHVSITRKLIVVQVEPA